MFDSRYYLDALNHANLSATTAYRKFLFELICKSYDDLKQKQNSMESLVPYFGMIVSAVVQDEESLRERERQIESDRNLSQRTIKLKGIIDESVYARIDTLNLDEIFCAINQLREFGLESAIRYVLTGSMTLERCRLKP